MIPPIKYPIRRFGIDFPMLSKSSSPKIMEVYNKSTGEKLLIKANRFNPEIHSKEPIDFSNKNQIEITTTSTDIPITLGTSTKITKKRGRPKGSKNKPK